MTQTIAEAWLKEGKANGQVLAIRAALKRQLAAKIGQLPAALTERIDATTDLDRLNAALNQMGTLRGLDDLQV